jgi:hypothetical protein
MDGNTTLQITAIKVVIAAFETRLVPAPEYRRLLRQCDVAVNET